MKFGKLRMAFPLLALVIGLTACTAVPGADAGPATIDSEAEVPAQQAPTDAETAAEAEAPAADTFPQNADGYADISVDQLAGMMEDKDFTLVNVHIPYQGDLPETDLSIPYNEIADHTDELPAKDQPIVLYCRSGSMSTQAAKELAGMGYTDVMELDGGFNAWQAAGHELVKTQ